MFICMCKSQFILIARVRLSKCNVLQYKALLFVI